MESFLFDRKHVVRYLIYGTVAGLLYSTTVWYVLCQPDFRNLHVLYIGCFLFMFTILVFSLRMSLQLPENKSTWTMMIEAHLAVSVGIVTALAVSGLLWTIYGRDKGAPIFPPKDLSAHWNAIKMIVLTATMGNFGAAAFLSAMAAYAIKPDQTTDQTPEIFEENPKPDDF